MRVNELLNLRVQDVQFGQNRLVVRSGTGDKDRSVSFPTRCREKFGNRGRRNHLSSRPRTLPANRCRLEAW